MATNESIKTLDEVKSSFAGFNGTYIAKKILDTDEFIKTWSDRRNKFNDKSLEILNDNYKELYELADRLVKRRVTKRTINGRTYKPNEWVDYNSYLKSEHWKTKKEKLYRKKKNQYCRKCGSTKNLQVHHKTYKTKYGQSVLFEESLGKLVVLCRKCHNKLHNS